MHCSPEVSGEVNLFNRTMQRMAPPPHVGRFPARIKGAMDLRPSALSAVTPIAMGATGATGAMGAMKIPNSEFRIQTSILSR